MTASGNSMLAGWKRDIILDFVLASFVLAITLH